jgi:hypothetical protein
MNKARSSRCLDYRYWGFYTDQDGDPRELEVGTMRDHAHNKRNSVPPGPEVDAVDPTT